MCFALLWVFWVDFFVCLGFSRGRGGGGGLAKHPIKYQREEPRRKPCIIIYSLLV